MTARATNKHDNEYIRSEIRSQTYEWLFKNIDMKKFIGVVFEHEKVEFCEAQGFDFLIDDAPRYAIKAQKQNNIVKVITPIRSWNTEVTERHSPQTGLNLMGIGFGKGDK